VTSRLAPGEDGVFVTTTHWGRFRVVVKDGEIRATTPIDDPEPATIGYTGREVDRTRGRILQPMVRTSYLRDREAPSLGRGADTFTAVSWDEALDLVADELIRAHETAGPSSIYGGSYGWASAGRFHHAQSQVHRFLNLSGGYTPSTDSYSYAAMARIVPHVLGITAEQHMLSFPTWTDIAEDVDLVVAFGGLPAKNGQVNPGGVHVHRYRAGQQLCAAAGVELVNISPSRQDLDLPGTEWVAVRPNTDTALMLGLTHEILTTGRADEGFLRECCTGLDELSAYLTGASDGVVKDVAWASRVCDVPEEAVRRLAHRISRGRTLITVSW
jgi:biotin/methionine sulfoxide reductase